MLPECYLRAHVNPLDWRSPCADFRPVAEASSTTALLLSVGGGSVSESNRSAAFGPLSGFEDHAHHRMKYAPEYSLAAARTSHGNEPSGHLLGDSETDSESAPTTHTTRFHRFAFFLSASMSFSTYRLNGDRIAAARPSCSSRTNSHVRHEATCFSTRSISASESSFKA